MNIGAGHSISRHCAKCGKAGPAKGGGLRMVYGYRQFVCSACKAILDALRKDKS